MNIKENLLDLIGDTPLVRLSKIKERFSLTGEIYAKLERCNPTGSIKDRASKFMIEDAIKEGKIDKETIIVEPTSGNTGIGLASICAYLKLSLVIFMPASASIERVRMMRAYGAEVILTDASLGMTGAVKAAEEFIDSHEKTFMPEQFENLSNSKAHYLTTGPEIYSALEGKIDIFVTSFGTGGTISGVGRYLKEKNKDIKVIGLEPLSSPFITSKKAGSHKIQGIGAGFKPGVLDLDVVDEVLTVSNEDAFEFTRILAKEEGLLCGISSGCNLFGAVEISRRYPGLNIVTILPDNGERYLSVEGLYE